MMSVKRTIAVLLVALSALPMAFAQFTGPAPLAWRWQQPTTVPPSGSATAQGDVVYVATGSRMYALHQPDGNQKWRFPAGEPLAAFFRGTPLVADGVAVCAADNKTIYGVDAETGAQKWSYISEIGIIGDIKQIGKQAIFQLADNSIMAINIADGKPFYDQPFRFNDPIDGRINVWEDDFLVFSGGRTLYSVNLVSRKVVWKVELENVSTDAYVEATTDTLYLASGPYLIGLSAGTGSSRFSRDLKDDIAFSPSASDSGVIAVTRSGLAYIFDPAGQVITRDGVDLKSVPFARPTALQGGTFVVLTANGAINLLDMTGAIVWNYLVRPIGGPVTVSNNNSGLGGNPPGPGGGFGGGPGAGFGGGPGSGLGGGPGGNQGGNNAKEPTKVVTIQAAGPATISGQTLFVLGRDGSLLAFDKAYGVDLTGPTVDMTFPTPGDQVSPRPPLALVFKIEDEASGVNENTLSIKIDDKPMDFEFNREGVAIVRFSLVGKNKILTDGKKKIVVQVSDWLGNTRTAEFSILIDDTLAPIVVAPANPGLGRGGGGGGKGGGGGQ